MDIRFVLVIRAREEADSAFNQGEFIAVGIPLDGLKNRVSEIVKERIVGIVSLGAVNDYSLEILVPRLRIAEKSAQGMFAFRLRAE